jgi:pyruvate dehydrogenase E2 component (dihydrolipoamide acetyltransferase)
MKKYPNFNSSLEHTGENIIYKKYFHIGVALKNTWRSMKFHWK